MYDGECPLQASCGNEPRDHCLPRRRVHRADEGCNRHDGVQNHQRRMSQDAPRVSIAEQAARDTWVPSRMRRRSKRSLIGPATSDPVISGTACAKPSPADSKRRTCEGIHLEGHCDHGHLPADQRDELTDAQAAKCRRLAKRAGYRAPDEPRSGGRSSPESTPKNDGACVVAVGSRHRLSHASLSSGRWRAHNSNSDRDKCYK